VRLQNPLQYPLQYAVTVLSQGGGSAVPIGSLETFLTFCGILDFDIDVTGALPRLRSACLFVCCSRAILWEGY
jgi:hypothetical protein